MVLLKAGKQKVVAELKEKLKKYPVVAVASLQNLPSRQYNAIKKKLRGKAEIIVARTTLLTRAIEEGRPELKELSTRFSGSAALVFTDQNPFQLFQTIRASKSKTAAKPGQIAPIDLVVPAGETNLAPGPVLTELKQAGVSAKIQGPKVVIDKDSTIAKKGAVITDAQAKVLAKLGVQPMEVGLNILAAFEKGTIYPQEILDIDTDAFREKIVLAHQQAVNLGVFAEIFNSTTTPLIILKAARAANAIKQLVESKSALQSQPQEAAKQQTAPAVAGQ